MANGGFQSAASPPNLAITDSAARRGTRAGMPSAVDPAGLISSLLSPAQPLPCAWNALLPTVPGGSVNGAGSRSWTAGVAFGPRMIKHFVASAAVSESKRRWAQTCGMQLLAVGDFSVGAAISSAKLAFVQTMAVQCRCTSVWICGGRLFARVSHPEMRLSNPAAAT